jgi:uncharacterized FlaG/YvyC family protein
LTLRREQVERELGDLAPFVRFRLEEVGADLRVCVPGAGPGGADRQIPLEALLRLRRRLADALGSMANDPPAGASGLPLAWEAPLSAEEGSHQGRR